ncbi:hypothetical protein ACWE42_11465 [Sutcliffiella cohnii]
MNELLVAHKTIVNPQKLLVIHRNEWIMHRNFGGSLEQATGRT